MKKESWALVLSGIAIGVSIACFITMLVRHEPFEFDITGSLMCFATLLVTLYVGAQVFHSFTIKQGIDKQNRKFLSEMREENKTLIKNIKEETKLEIEAKLEDYDHTITASIYQIYAITECYRRNQFKKATIYLFKALSEANKASDKTPLSGILDYLKATLNDGGGHIKLSNDEVKEYTKELALCGEEKAINLIPNIQSLCAK